MVQNMDEKEVLLDCFELDTMQFGDKKLLLDYFKPNITHFLDERNLLFEY